MTETVAAIFGVSVDDIVKIIGAISMLIGTVVGAVARMIVTLRGARKRSFQKIRRVEDILEILVRSHPADPNLTMLLAEMKQHQRDPADAKDNET